MYVLFTITNLLNMRNKQNTYPSPSEYNTHTCSEDRKTYIFIIAVPPTRLTINHSEGMAKCLNLFTKYLSVMFIVYYQPNTQY